MVDPGSYIHGGCPGKKVKRGSYQCGGCPGKKMIAMRRDLGRKVSWTV